MRAVRPFLRIEKSHEISNIYNTVGNAFIKGLNSYNYKSTRLFRTIKLLCTSQAYVYLQNWFILIIHAIIIITRMQWLSKSNLHSVRELSPPPPPDCIPWMYNILDEGIRSPGPNVAPDRMTPAGNGRK